MFKFLVTWIFAVITCVTAKPHLFTTGVSYATPAVVAPILVHPIVNRPIVAATAVHMPFVVTPAYYPTYTASYATYPYLGGATYFIRR